MMAVSGGRSGSALLSYVTLDERTNYDSVGSCVHLIVRQKAPMNHDSPLIGFKSDFFYTSNIHMTFSQKLVQVKLLIQRN